MNYLGILKRIISVSLITSLMTFLASFLISLLAEKNFFANYTIFTSLIGLGINVMPFGACMLLNVTRYNVSSEVYFNYMRVAIGVVSPSILVLSIILFPLLKNLDLFNLNAVDIFVILFICYFNTINLAVISYLRVSQSFSKYSLFFTVYTFNNTLLIFIGLLVTDSFTYSLLLSLFFAFVLACFSIFFGAELHRVKFKSFEISDVVGLFKYGFPIVLSTTTMSFLVLGDKLIFGSLNNADFPKYAIASLIASTSLFLVNNFASSWGAYLAKSLSEKSLAERRAFCLSKIHLIFISIPILVALLIIQLSIYMVLYETEFPNLTYSIVILTMAYVTFGASKFFMGFINFEKKNFYLFLTSFSGVIVILICSMLVTPLKLHHMPLIVLSGMISQFIFCIFITKSIYGDVACSTNS